MRVPQSLPFLEGTQHVWYLSPRVKCCHTAELRVMSLEAAEREGEVEGKEEGDEEGEEEEEREVDRERARGEEVMKEGVEACVDDGGDAVVGEG